MTVIRRSHDQLGFVQDIGKRLDIPGAIARSIGVGDISGDSRLASG
jgi:hypothetical protein